MIDDARIAADDAQAFATAVRTFMRRYCQANATLKNGDEWSQLSDKRLIEKGRTEATQYVFLGEEYLHAGPGAPTQTRNCAENLDKLRAACARFRERTTEARLMRAYSAIAAAATDERSWEAPASVRRARGGCGRALVAYDAIIYVDVSASGYGAFVAFRDGRIFEVRGGWSALMPHSAHAEPLAARVVLDWLYATHPGTANVAVVSDHQPMATFTSLLVQPPRRVQRRVVDPRP